jgi:hypothetical protein
MQCGVSQLEQPVKLTNPLLVDRVSVEDPLQGLPDLAVPLRALLLPLVPNALRDSDGAVESIQGMCRCGYRDD